MLPAGLVLKCGEGCTLTSLATEVTLDGLILAISARSTAGVRCIVINCFRRRRGAGPGDLAIDVAERDGVLVER